MSFLLAILLFKMNMFSIVMFDAVPSSNPKTLTVIFSVAKVVNTLVKTNLQLTVSRNLGECFYGVC